MNAYLVKTKDEREYVEPVMDDGSGPRFPVWPMAPVVADGPGRAKSLFLGKYAHNGSRTGVYSDDFTNLRVSTLQKNVDLEEGVHDDEGPLWDLIFQREIAFPREDA